MFNDNENELGGVNEYTTHHHDPADYQNIIKHEIASTEMEAGMTVFAHVAATRIAQIAPDKYIPLNGFKNNKYIYQCEGRFDPTILPVAPGKIITPPHREKLLTHSVELARK